MPALLKRSLIKVGPKANENTLTLSSVSNDGHYISLRPLVKPTTPEEKAFPFEWAFAGTKDDVAVTKEADGRTKQVFDFWFDSNKYLNIPNTHTGKVETYWEEWNSGCLEETGVIYPFGKDKEGVEFTELWQPLNPNREEFVIAKDASTEATSIVFKTTSPEYNGLVVVVGQWIQGFLCKVGGSTTDDINFVRYYREESDCIVLVQKFGKDIAKFPHEFYAVRKGNCVNADGVKWQVIESHVVVDDE